MNIYNKGRIFMKIYPFNLIKLFKVCPNNYLQINKN